MSRNQTILNSVLDAIGHTPCIRLNRIPQEHGLECEVVAKCEYFSAGGSVKDRIGKAMIERAEKDGRIEPGYTLIEPTSGNTGIGLALGAAVKGYETIITLPEKMSREKVDVMKALGAQIIRTPTEAAWDAPDSHISVANRLRDSMDKAVILDQYANPANPDIHYETTAEEILAACDGRIDMFVASAGTGGTISGVARKLKEKCPNIIIVGVDPKGSILALPENLNEGGVSSYQVEGIGYDFIPDVLDRKLVDQWVKTEDKEAFGLARDLIRKEGMLVGGSSGSALAGAIQAAKGLKKGQRVVVLFPDSIRNYMSKHLNDDWMVEHGFLDAPELDLKNDPYQGATVADLKLPSAVSTDHSTTLSAALDIMKERAFDQLPVLNGGKLVGLVTLGDIHAKVASGRATLEDPVSKVMYNYTTAKKYLPVHTTTKLGTLGKFFEGASAAVVTGDDGKLLHVFTKLDLLDYLRNKSA